MRRSSLLFDLESNGIVDLPDLIFFKGNFLFDYPLLCRSFIDDAEILCCVRWWKKKTECLLTELQSWLRLNQHFSFIVTSSAVLRVCAKLLGTQWPIVENLMTSHTNLRGLWIETFAAKAKGTRCVVPPATTFKFNATKRDEAKKHAFDRKRVNAL
jgi:hypothetical protein